MVSEEQRVAKLMTCTTYLIAAKCSRLHVLLAILNSFGWNLRLLACIRLSPNVEPSKLLMAIITLISKLYKSLS